MLLEFHMRFLGILNLRVFLQPVFILKGLLGDVKQI